MQPADVCWFKLLKNKYKVFWNHWFVNEPKTFTPYGNIAGPGYHFMTRWITAGWVELNSEYIRESFKYCGIGCRDPNEYHTELKKILIDNLVPKTTIVDFLTEDDEFNDVFDSFNSEDEDEEFVCENVESSYSSEEDSDDSDDCSTNSNDITCISDLLSAAEDENLFIEPSSPKKKLRLDTLEIQTPKILFSNQ